jgi:DNA-binding transcriptional ArsR family regulator
MASMSPHVAEIANLVGDLARANILLALMDHRALTAGELAHVARVSPQTTSSHLVKLTNAKLVQVTQQGRHRYYRLASPLVAQMLETVMVVAGDRISNLKPLSKASEDLRAARSCYDHLAGRLGVAFADALMARGFVILEPEGAQLTPCGMDFLDKLGLEIRALPRARRIFCRPCLDWSERRYHLQAVSARFFSDSAWTVNGLNAGAIAERCESPDSAHSNSRKYSRSSIRHR